MSSPKVSTGLPFYNGPKPISDTEAQPIENFQAGPDDVESMKRRATLSAGDWVQVRTREEILRTLDERGQVEGLPFMPEMFQYCGRRLQVWKRAHKTCDTTHQTGGRRMQNAVHLRGVRCDGSAHGGCDASCMIFWKETWLKPVDVPSAPACAKGGGCTEAQILEATRKLVTRDRETPGYACQATQLFQATSPLRWWDYSQYLEDYTSGNAGLGRLVRAFIYSACYSVMQAGIGLGRPLRWLYDKFQAVAGGPPFPRRSGRIPANRTTPVESLNLQPGELVRVKSYPEILATLNTENQNRGLLFDAEMVPYCGRIYRARKRVSRIVDEKTGAMLEMKHPCIILEDVVCQSRYSTCRMLCPRSIYPYWREIWLERVPSAEDSPARKTAST
jgi:hypothetical protein